MTLISSTPTSPVVTLAQYRTVTRETASADADVTAELAEAEGLVGDELGRPLALGTYTERLRLFTPPATDLVGWYYAAYPSVTPLATVVTVGPTILGESLISVSPEAGPFFERIFDEVYATIAYTGGWTSTTLPASLRRAVATVANRLLTPIGVPVGASLSVKVGDTAFSYGGAGVPDLIDPGVLRALRPFRRRTLA